MKSHRKKSRKALIKRDNSQVKPEEVASLILETENESETLSSVGRGTIQFGISTALLILIILSSFGLFISLKQV